ncbi:MAG: hypothetical protein HC763_20545 [Hydrococcus sp. CRU_1_1]|nr:hypothetical protein [Hydrococcus sp. CRU_1_1]
MTILKKRKELNLLDSFLSQRLQKKLNLVIKDYFSSLNQNKRKVQNEVFQILVRACPPTQGLFKKDFWLVLSQNVNFLWTLIVSVLLVIIIFFSSFSEIKNLISGSLVLSYLVFQFKIELEDYTFNQWISLIAKAKQAE